VVMVEGCGAEERRDRRKDSDSKLEGEELIR